MKCKFLYALLPVVCSVEVFAADTLLCKVNRASDWAFYGTDKPAAQVSLVNRRQVGKGYNLKCEISCVFTAVDCYSCNRDTWWHLNDGKECVSSVQNRAG